MDPEYFIRKTQWNVGGKHQPPECVSVNMAPGTTLAFMDPVISSQHAVIDKEVHIQDANLTLEADEPSMWPLESCRLCFSTEQHQRSV